jgi:hypothetical protein
LRELKKLKETKKINKDRVKEIFEYGGQLVKHGTHIYTTYKNAQFNDLQAENQDKQYFAGLKSKEGMFDRELAQNDDQFSRKLNKDIEMFNVDQGHKIKMFNSEMDYNREVQTQQQKQWEAANADAIISGKITRDQIYKKMEKAKKNKQDYELGFWTKAWNWLTNNPIRGKVKKTRGEFKKEYENPFFGE